MAELRMEGSGKQVNGRGLMEEEDEANLDLDFYLIENQESMTDEGESTRSNNLRSAVDEVKCGEPTRQLSGLHQLRKIYSFDDDLINDELGYVLIDCLERDDWVELQYEAARMLRYIARNDTTILIENDLAPLFSNLLNSPSEEAQEQGLRAIAIVAEYVSFSRDFEAIPDDIIFNLLPFFYRPKAPFKLFLFALKSLVYIVRCKAEDTIIALAPVKELLETGEDLQVQRLACKAILYFSEQCETIESIVGNGICPCLVDLLFHDSPHLLLPVMKTMVNISDYGNYKELINGRALSRIVAIISTGDKRESDTARQLHREICRFVYSITTLTQDDIELTINTGVISALVALLADGVDVVKEEAASAIVSGISNGSDEQVEYFVDLDCINLLINLMTPGKTFLERTCVKGLDRMLMLIKGKNKYPHLFRTARLRLERYYHQCLKAKQRGSVFRPAKRPRPG